MAHTYIIGQPGTGKSTLLSQYALDDLNAGSGMLFLDGTGTTIAQLLPRIPKHRIKDVILFDPSREDVLALNPLENAKNSSLTASIVLETMKDVAGYGDDPTPTMDMYMFACFQALAEAGEPLLGWRMMLNNPQYREHVLKRTYDIETLSFWHQHTKLPPQKQADLISSSYNKAFMLMADHRIRRIFAYRQSSFSIADIVKGKILLVSLPIGQLSKGRSRTLGSVLLSLIAQACLTRDTAVPFSIYLDDCHLWAPTTITTLMTSAHTHNVNVYLAHQYISQLPRECFEAIIGTASLQIVLKTSIEDAQKLYDRMDGDQKRGTRFDQLKPFQARFSPFYSSHRLDIEPLAEPEYLDALKDLEWQRKTQGRYTAQEANAEADAFLRGKW